MNAPAITRYVHLVCGAEPGDAIAVSCTARLDPHHVGDWCKYADVSAALDAAVNAEREAALNDLSVSLRKSYPGDERIPINVASVVADFVRNIRARSKP